MGLITIEAGIETENHTRSLMKKILSSVGPAIIVAAAVLGPGSILTSSKVGATFGLIGLPVLLIGSTLMIGMVALSARLGAVYDDSPCSELAKRLGRPVAAFIGVVLFLIVALFQSSNNIAVIGGIEPMLGGEPLSIAWRCTILIAMNFLMIAVLYAARTLYRSVEQVMKLLLGVMTVAFLLNFLCAMMIPRGFEPVESTTSPDLIPLIGLFGTTFSVAGAFYGAYLVKEKGWGLEDVRAGLTDSILGISALGIVSAVILATTWRVFYGDPQPVTLNSIGQIADQLEPLFGTVAMYIFSIGILAAALSSFLVNALIGGTVLSDSLGMGSTMQDRSPLNFTALALLVGMGMAIWSVAWESSTVTLITLAQALTVLGNPALALVLIYLASRPELKAKRIPRWILVFGFLGFLASCIAAYSTATKIL